MSASANPRNASRFESAAPSSSWVDSRTVANRQCSVGCEPPSSNTPKCVCVLPTSTTSSIGELHQCWAAAAHCLSPAERFQRVGQPRPVGKREFGVEL